MVPEQSWARPLSPVKEACSWVNERGARAEAVSMLAVPLT